MSYLIQQMWLCLLLAALLGVIIGWWLAKTSCRSKLNDLDASWQKKVDELDQEYATKLTEANKPAAAGTAAGVISKAEQVSYEIEEVEGIGKSYGNKLRDKGITTTQQLLDQCCNIDGRIEIANHIGIEDFVVYKWASMCDLMRINGIEGQFAELMVYAGIDSVQDLGQQDTNKLYNNLLSSNDEQKRVKEIPDPRSLEMMIGEAKELPVLMQGI